jgi:ribosomal protein L37AE/L43A
MADDDGQSVPPAGRELTEAAAVIGVYTGDWISRACPRCISDQTVQTVRANATAFACRACGYAWAVQRMPSDAEAADILRRSRQTRAEALSNEAAAGSTDGKALPHENA